MNIIVCIDEKNGIGKDNKLLFSIPDDMKFFSEKTRNNIVIMGRKTLYSFPNKAPLKNRINIVYTKNKKDLENEYKNYDNIYFVDSDEDLKCNLDDIHRKYKDTYNEEYIIGGESIYKKFINKCDTLYITRVYKVMNADTFFPDFKEFREIEKSDMKDYEGTKYQFIKYHI